MEPRRSWGCSDPAGAFPKPCVGRRVGGIEEDFLGSVASQLRQERKGGTPLGLVRERRRSSRRIGCPASFGSVESAEILRWDPRLLPRAPLPPRMTWELDPQKILNQFLALAR